MVSFGIVIRHEAAPPVAPRISQMEDREGVCRPKRTKRIYTATEKAKTKRVGLLVLVAKKQLQGPIELLHVGIGKLTLAITLPESVSMKYSRF